MTSNPRWLPSSHIFRLVALWICLTIPTASADAASTEIQDDAGHTLAFTRPPTRVVSLVPSASEILAALGCEAAVVGVTYHDVRLPRFQEKNIVGGFFSPDPERIRTLQPDLIILSGLHTALAKQLADVPCPRLVMDTRRLADSARHIRLLGAIFERSAQAEAVIAHNADQIDLIRRKVDRIPEAQRRRVIRLMGRDQVMRPGDDSFQNELIAAAGGIPPRLGQNGPVTPVSLDQWRAFNPEVIYGCGEDRLTAQAFFQLPGWRDVAAIATGRIVYFPCELTCRAAAHTGLFVSWLASIIYPDLFAQPAYQVLEDAITDSRPVSIDLPVVREAHIVTSRVRDFENKSLIIRLAAPQIVVSTLEGQRSGISTVGNHYSSPPCWALDHAGGIEAVRDRVYRVIGLTEDTSSFLFTGADMDNLAIREAEFKDMKAVALVTAGAETNAQRVSRDSGDWYEPGTINILIFTNTTLSPRAMTRAIIVATEAKTAALEDMDIRSSYTPQVHPATGTGTDNVLVVQGQGRPVDNTGGHSKMGELIGAAVYAGVKEALLKQNGTAARRSIFKRLEERRISLHALADGAVCDCLAPRSALAAEVEHLLLTPAPAGFMEAALTLSDAFERGLVTDLSGFQLWCAELLADLSGQPATAVEDLIPDAALPQVLHLAVNTLFNIARARLAPTLAQRGAP